MEIFSGSFNKGDGEKDANGNYGKEYRSESKMPSSHNQRDNKEKTHGLMETMGLGMEQKIHVWCKLGNEERGQVNNGCQNRFVHLQARKRSTEGSKEAEAEESLSPCKRQMKNKGNSCLMLQDEEDKNDIGWGLVGSGAQTR